VFKSLLHSSLFLLGAHSGNFTFQNAEIVVSEDRRITVTHFGITCGLCPRRSNNLKLYGIKAFQTTDRHSSVTMASIRISHCEKVKLSAVPALLFEFLHKKTRK